MGGFGAVDGGFGGEEGAESGYGSNGVFAQAQHIPNEAFVELDAGGIYGAFVEGLEFSVLEVSPDGLGLFQLPGLELADVEGG